MPSICRQLHIEGEHAAIVVEADFILDEKTMALAGRNHVDLARKTQLDRFSGLPCQHGSGSGHPGCIIFLSAKPPPSLRTTSVIVETMPSRRAQICWTSVGFWVEE